MKTFKRFVGVMLCTLLLFAMCYITSFEHYRSNGYGYRELIAISAIIFVAMIIITSAVVGLVLLIDWLLK